MFSSIQDLLRSAGVSRDPKQANTLQPKREETRQSRAAVEPSEDDTLFSIAAIRALLTTDPLPADVADALKAGELEDILKALASLEAQGIHNIPLKSDQTLLDAVRGVLPAVR